MTVRAPPGPARVWVPAAVAAATLATFTPALWNDFLNYDDYAITSNPAYQGLGLTQLKWMFTAVTTGHYMPIAWLSLALDYVIWGLNAPGFHLTNILIHAGSALLFYLIALRLYRATAFPAGVLRLAAAAAALFFALHPLNVACVAWVSARNSLLSAFFALASVLLYLEAQPAARARRWLLAASSVAYLLSLGSKAVVVALPLVLVLLDIHPLRRWGGARERRALLLEKVPYLVLSVAGAAIAYFPRRPVTLSVDYPWAARVAVTMHGLWFYVRKTVVPQGLSPIYELPATIDPLAPEFLWAAAGVVALSVLALSAWRRWPSGLAVWVYYGLTLAPVSGVVFTGWLAADPYGYLPCLGFALLWGGASGVLANAWISGRLRTRWARAAGSAIAAGILGLAVLSALQVQVWRSAESLWRHAVEVTPECFICQTNRGLWLLAHGSPLSGLGHLQRAKAVRPDRPEAHVNLGQALARLGMLPEAIETYERALGRFPDAVAIRILLAQALLDAGRAREAIDHFRQAIAREPAAPMARLGLVRAHLAVGEITVARGEYEALGRLDPALAREVAGAFPSRP